MLTNFNGGTYLIESQAELLMANRNKRKQAQHCNNNITTLPEKTDMDIKRTTAELYRVTSY